MATYGSILGNHTAHLSSGKASTKGNRRPVQKVTQTSTKGNRRGGQSTVNAKHISPESRRL